MLMDLFELGGKTALVTGASRGLGRQFAHTLARAGADLVLAARDREKLEAVAEEIRLMGRRAFTVVMDVTDRAMVVDGVKAAEEAAGPLRILVNNSGIAITKRLLEVEEDDWREVIDTNLTGAWFVAQEVARAMAAHGEGGSIVNIASLLGVRTLPGVVGYNAAKAGLIHLTRVMAMDLARHSIRVNALAPGYFATEMNQAFFESEPGKAMIRRIPQRRLGQEGDLDGPLLLLASDAGRYVTGQTLLVDGGHSVASI